MAVSAIAYERGPCCPGHAQAASCPAEKENHTCALRRRRAHTDYLAAPAASDLVKQNRYLIIFRLSCSGCEGGLSGFTITTLGLCIVERAASHRSLATVKHRIAALASLQHFVTLILSAEDEADATASAHTAFSGRYHSRQAAVGLVRLPPLLGLPPALACRQRSLVRRIPDGAVYVCAASAQEGRLSQQPGRHRRPQHGARFQSWRPCTTERSPQKCSARPSAQRRQPST